MVSGAHRLERSPPDFKCRLLVVERRAERARRLPPPVVDPGRRQRDPELSRQILDGRFVRLDPLRAQFGDGPVLQLDRSNAPAHDVSRLEDGDRHARGNEANSRGEPGEAGAHDGDPRGGCSMDPGLRTGGAYVTSLKRRFNFAPAPGGRREEEPDWPVTHANAGLPSGGSRDASS